MMKQLKASLILCIASALVLMVALCISPISTWAQTSGTDDTTTVGSTSGEDEGTTEGGEEGDDTTVDEEEPAFNNPAQAQHAANLAEAAATGPSDELGEALENLAEAEKALEEAIASGDKAAIEAAQKAYDEANEKAEGLAAEETGVTVEDIAAMRAEGMGWGQIAHTLGVHPSVLGLGHKFQETEMEEATARNTKSDSSFVGHGVGQGTGQGLALGHDKAADGSKGGKGGGQGGGQGQGGGKGGGQGQGGGQGGGHGGGHGGGNNK
ncbi:MAG: hypothetical protein JXA50_04890 [Deltaproteobacteria bacterium]|nr:hypothetical protein [Deltaproteobacteria bacterium]